MTTQAQRDAILARDAAERAGEGGIGHFTHYTLVGVANGRGDYTKSTVGPLAGQVAKDWTLTLFYADGRERVVRDLGGRGVPALA